MKAINLLCQQPSEQLIVTLKFSVSEWSDLRVATILSMVGPSKQANKQTNIHTHVRNESR